jgi:hypothetical protein
LESRQLERSLASSVIVAFSTRETGQFAFAWFAALANA